MEELKLKNGDILIIKNSRIPEKERDELWIVDLDFENEIINLKKHKKGIVDVVDVESFAFEEWIYLKNLKVPRYRGPDKRNGKFDNGLKYRPVKEAPFDYEKGGESE